MELLIDPVTQAQLGEITKKPPHALLLTAPEGAGKRAVARQLAARLLDVTEESLDGSAHWLQVTPEPDQPFGIDAVRSATHFMRLRSTHQGSTVQRIAFLPDAHTMTKEAQNALLKLLEEPPAGSMLILTAPTKQSLLSTIVSRCQELHLTTPALVELATAFEKAGYAERDIKLALSISGGLPGLAASLLDPSLEHPLHEAVKTARSLLSESTFERLVEVDGLAKQRQSCLELCYILQQMAHAALRSAGTEAADRWQRVLSAGYDCEQALQARANAKLAMTDLMLSL